MSSSGWNNYDYMELAFCKVCNVDFFKSYIYLNKVCIIAIYALLHLISSSLTPLLKNTIRMGIDTIFEGALDCFIGVEILTLQEDIQI